MCIFCKDYNNNYLNYNFCPMCGESFNKNYPVPNITTSNENQFTPTPIIPRNNINTDDNTDQPVRGFLK